MKCRDNTVLIYCGIISACSYEFYSLKKKGGGLNKPENDS